MHWHVQVLTRSFYVLIAGALKSIWYGWFCFGFLSVAWKSKEWLHFFVCLFFSVWYQSPKQFVFPTSKGNSCLNKSPLKSTSHFGHKRACQSFHFVIYFACPHRSRKYYFPFSAFYSFLKTAFCLLLCTWTRVVFFCLNLLWNFSIWSSQLLICYVAHVWSLWLFPYVRNSNPQGTGCEKQQLGCRFKCFSSINSLEFTSCPCPSLCLLNSFSFS